MQSTIMGTWKILSIESSNAHFKTPEVSRCTFPEVNTRITLFLVYVIVGHYYEHLGLMVAMEESRLLEKGNDFHSGNTLKYM